MLKSPYPYFGGKSQVAELVWSRIGYDIYNFNSSFFGSGAIELARVLPATPFIETVNDINGYIANFWRAIQHAPEEVAHYADWPINENDLHARHRWLMGIGRNSLDVKEFTDKLENDPDFYDAKAAGWWVWGISMWIGGGWCKTASRKGPELSKGGNKGVHSERVSGSPSRGMPHLSKGGNMGVHSERVSGSPNKQLPRLSRGNRGIHQTSLTKPRPNLRPHNGIHAKRPTLERGNRGVHGGNDIYSFMEQLSTRMRRVRVCCGDFERILGYTPTVGTGQTAVILDPPYSKNIPRMHQWLSHLRGDSEPPEGSSPSSNRSGGLYSNDNADDMDLLVARVLNWVTEEVTFSVPTHKNYYQGPRDQHPKLRIVLFGYEGEHNELDTRGWEKIAWKAQGGYSNSRKAGTNDNNGRERIWFSPHCLKPDKEELPLFKYLNNMV